MSTTVHVNGTVKFTFLHTCALKPFGLAINSNDGSDSDSIWNVPL